MKRVELVYDRYLDGSISPGYSDLILICMQDTEFINTKFYNCCIIGFKRINFLNCIFRNTSIIADVGFKTKQYDEE
jgi:hypothetical protein